MIEKRIILEFAREMAVAPEIIEKDYMLGWLLAAIGHHPQFREAWVFKGGTCLKKCFFETYRFSEDLDFTIRDHAHLTDVFLGRAFGDIAEWVYENAGLKLLTDTMKFEVHREIGEARSVEGRIGYESQIIKGSQPRIRLDLSSHEVVVTTPVLREVYHPYPDRPESGISVKTYSFEELFAEKIRALGERARPRDLYDVIHLYRHKDLHPDKEALRSTLRTKCAFKKIALPTMEFMAAHPNLGELQTEWANMLTHQLPMLPPFEQYWGELPTFFEWLREPEMAREEVATPIQAESGLRWDGSWIPPTHPQLWHTGIPIEIIRFAAANRLCIKIMYSGISGGGIKERVIEPYALRRSQAGDLYLVSVKHESGETRSYRLDRMQRVEVTNIPFAPRFDIELNASGPVAIPARSSGLGRFRSSRTRTPKIRFAVGVGIKHVYQCSVCGRKFTKGSMDSMLRPHKGKQGLPCHGRFGTYVGTK